MQTSNCSSAAWKLFIQRPSFITLEEQIRAIKDSIAPTAVLAKNRKENISVAMLPTTQATAFSPPLLNIEPSCFPIELREKALSLLGLDIRKESFVKMSSLMFSILCLSTPTTCEGERKERTMVVELLLQESSEERLSEEVIGKGSNALHLAAFLRLEEVFSWLISTGCDPSHKNGCGVDANEVFMMMSGFSPGDSTTVILDLQEHENDPLLLPRAITREPLVAQDINFREIGDKLLLSTDAIPQIYQMTFEESTSLGDNVNNVQVEYEQEIAQQEFMDESQSTTSDDQDLQTEPAYTLYMLMQCPRLEMDTPRPISVLRYTKHTVSYMETRPQLSRNGYHDYVKRLGIQSGTLDTPHSLQMDLKTVRWSPFKDVCVFQKQLDISQLDDDCFSEEELKSSMEALDHRRENVIEIFYPGLATELSRSSILVSPPPFSTPGFYNRYQESQSRADLSLDDGLEEMPTSHTNRPLPDIPVQAPIEDLSSIIPEYQTQSFDESLHERASLPHSTALSLLVPLEYPNRKSYHIWMPRRGEHPINIQALAYEKDENLLSRVESLPSTSLSRLDKQSLLPMPRALSPIKEFLSKTIPLVPAFKGFKSTSKLPLERSYSQIPLHSPLRDDQEEIKSIGEDSSKSLLPIHLRTKKIRQKRGQQSLEASRPRRMKDSSYGSDTINRNPSGSTTASQPPQPQDLDVKRGTMGANGHSDPCNSPPCLHTFQNVPRSPHAPIPETLPQKALPAIPFKSGAKVVPTIEPETKGPSLKEKCKASKNMTTAIPTSMRPIDWKKRKIVRSPSNRKPSGQISRKVATRAVARRSGHSPQCGMASEHDTKVEIEVQCADSSGDCIFPLSANDADSGGNTQALCNSVDLTEESSLDQALTPKLIERGPSAILYPKKSIWYDASVNDARSFRKTLSTPDVDVTADTGVLYMRVRGLVEFSLPIPQEKTMVSIRIDTGMEKLDTDYVYLNDIEALFQQEFCIPVRPGLEISLTLHLMQAPHLQPRYMPPIPTHYITPDAYDYACTLEDYLEERIHPSIPRCKGYGLALGCSPQKNQGGLLSNEKWMGDTLPHCNFRNHPLEMTTAWNLDVDPWTNLSPDTITSRCDNSKNNEGFLTTASPMQGVSKEKPTHRHRDLAGVFRSWRDSILNTVSKRHKSETTSGTSRSKDRMPKGCSMDLTDREQLFQEAFWPIEHSLWMEDYSKRMDGSIGKSSTVSQSSTLVQSSPLSTSSSIPQTSSPSLTRSSTVVSDHEDIGCHADGSTGLQEASSEDEGRGADEYGEHPLSLLSGIKFLPQLSETEIKREETPVQVLTRFIDFKDELCIGRSGIVFKDIQGSCSNQIVNVEFLTVNTWMDKNDYSRLVFSGVGSNNGLYTPEYHLDSAVTKLADPCSRPNTMREQTSGQSNEEDMSIEKSEIKYKEDVSTESDGCADKEEEGWKSQTVAKVLTTLCFIPGPQMDPEDAIYEDPESYPVTEPQSLAECQLGLIYFNWQNHVFYEGQLFYLTEQQTWQEGFFQLKGSRLWQVDEYDTEKRIRWMDLSTIRQIVTSMGCFKATAQYLDEDDGGGEDNERRTSSPSSLLMDESGRVLLSESLRVDPEETGEEDGSLCPIENGFRLLLMSPSLETEQDVGKSRSTMGRDGSDVKEGDGPGGDKMLQRNQSKLGGCVMQQQHQSRMVAQGFYAGSPDEAQAWVVALMCSCRDRPPPPHWLDGDS